METGHKKGHVVIVSNRRAGRLARLSSRIFRNDVVAELVELVRATSSHVRSPADPISMTGHKLGSGNPVIRGRFMRTITQVRVRGLSAALPDSEILVSVVTAAFP